MIINLRGIKALQQLRIEHQESAGLAFPHACFKEMLVLYDVCKYLDLSMFQAQEVLGAPAWKMVTDYINSSVGQPTDAASQLVGSVSLH
jgi:hypothetical protein